MATMSSSIAILTFILLFFGCQFYCKAQEMVYDDDDDDDIDENSTGCIRKYRELHSYCIY